MMCHFQRKNSCVLSHLMLTYSQYGLTVSMDLQSVWTYSQYGLTISMDLQSVWTYSQYGLTVSMDLQSVQNTHVCVCESE